MHPDLQQRRRVGAAGPWPCACSWSGAGARACSGTLSRGSALSVPLASDARLQTFVAAFGGEARGEALLRRFAPLEDAREGDLAPFFRAQKTNEARAAAERGACLLIQAELLPRLPPETPAWVHPFATWAMAKVLKEHAVAQDRAATLGRDVEVGPHAVLSPRVVIGDRVVIGASAVIGSPGFGWASGPNGERVHVPQLGGVVIEDDVWIGPLVTIDAGTLSPTVVRRGAKLDAHVHVGHNCEIGEGTHIAAQTGLAGSARIGRGVLIGGQVGIGDHVHVGDGARIAGKSGVIGDIPAGAVVGGYPAVPRMKWLRGLARLYRGH